MNILSWICFVAGGLSGSFGGLLWYRLKFSNNDAPIIRAIESYRSIPEKELSTSIAELDQQMKSGETRYPVLVRGLVHCWDSDLKPLNANLVDAQCCYRQMYIASKLVDERKLDFYLRDPTKRDCGINIPWEHLYYTPNKYNITLSPVEHKSPEYGHIQEFFLPFGADMFAIGKVEKIGNRLILKPHEKIPDSLLVVQTLNSTPKESIELFESVYTVMDTTLKISIPVTLGFFGLGYYFRQRKNQ